MKAINVILALFVSAFLSFGVAEIGLRLLGFAPPAINTEDDAALGWRKRANSSIEMKSDEYDVTIQTDAHGLRDDYNDAEVPPKPAGTTRMLFLGDSFTLGSTVAREDLFVDLLEQAWLDEGRKIEIVNAGTQAYSTDQALVWLLEFGAQFDPDVVVLFPFENDIWWNAQPTYLGQDKPLFDEAGTLVSGELAVNPPRGWFASTAVGNLLRRTEKMPMLKVDGLDDDIIIEQSSRLVTPPTATLDAEARTKVLFEKIAETSRTLGAKFAVCPLPSRAAVTPPKKSSAALDPARPYELFLDAATAAGALTLQPLGALKTAAANGWTPYYSRDFHMNAEGNLILAQVVKTDLEAAGLVPVKATADAQPVTLLDTVNPAAPPATPVRIPRWPTYFIGLWAALGTLYHKTYPSEGAVPSYAKVAGLLGVVFATAIGVTALIAALPPLYGKLLLVALVIALLTFVLYKLGDRVGTIAELMKAFTLRGHWYLMPLLTVLLTVGSLLVVAASSPLIAPFIYTLF